MSDDIANVPPEIPEDVQKERKAYQQKTIVTHDSSAGFVGFKIKQPEYFVVTPQTLQEFTVRSLVVSEEQALKGTMTNPKKLPEHLNKILWDTIVKKPDSIQTYDDFLNTLTIPDRDTLLYALYHISYKDISNYELTCPNCRHKFPVSMSINQIFKLNAWPGERKEVLSKRVEVELEMIEPKAIAVIKQPTLRDEANMLSNILFQSDRNLEIGGEMMMLDYIKLIPDENVNEENFKKLSDRDELFRAYCSLPSAMKKKLVKEYVENFGKYSMDLKIESTCGNCGHTFDIDLDLGTQFFRAMYE